MTEVQDLVEVAVNDVSRTYVAQYSQKSCAPVVLCVL